MKSDLQELRRLITELRNDLSEVTLQLHKLYNLQTVSSNETFGELAKRPKQAKIIVSAELEQQAPPDLLKRFINASFKNRDLGPVVTLERVRLEDGSWEYTGTEES